MTDQPSKKEETAAPALPDKEVELNITTIPTEFYGAGLQMPVEEKKKQEVKVAPVAMPGAPKRSKLPIILVAVFLLIAIGGGFVYFNRSLLFPASVPTPAAVVVETPSVEAPSAPFDVSATSTNSQSVSLRWTDAAANESGFRVERHDGDGNFSSLTSLPPNSTSFLDLSVESGATYTYRIRAINEAGESDASDEASALVKTQIAVVPTRPELPPAGLDTDSDGLSDLEEVLYGTNSKSPDTDADGFLDGNEVFHLYNPAGTAPVKLLDSALVKIITAPVGWVLSIPTSWVITFNAAQGTQATIDTQHGELFTVAIKENPNKKSILEWYLAENPDVTATQVIPFRSKGGYEGIVGTNLLTTYIPWEDNIFVMTYELNEQPFINFRTTYSMMLNSLVLSGMPEIMLPEPGTPLPFEPSATPTTAS
ncbi:MAG: fibronectin type III domain-containing protein [Patescibacteria group bacterium]|nr:fibronectin type III domain-containing protein [Patescibacteria group bacterium]